MRKLAGPLSFYYISTLLPTVLPSALQAPTHMPFHVNLYMGAEPWSLLQYAIIMFVMQAYNFSLTLNKSFILILIGQSPDFGKQKKGIKHDLINLFTGQGL